MLNPLPGGSEYPFDLEKNGRRAPFQILRNDLLREAYRLQCFFEGKIAPRALAPWRTSVPCILIGYGAEDCREASPGRTLPTALEKPARRFEIGRAILAADVAVNNKRGHCRYVRTDGETRATGLDLECIAADAAVFMEVANRANKGNNESLMGIAPKPEEKFM